MYRPSRDHRGEKTGLGLGGRSVMRPVAISRMRVFSKPCENTTLFPSGDQFGSPWLFVSLGSSRFGVPP